jgi:hypothetical protein
LGGVTVGVDSNFLYVTLKRGLLRKLENTKQPGGQMELFSISTKDQDVSIFIGETELSGVPSLELAEKFVAAAKAKGWDEELLLNTDSRRGG